MQPWCIETRPEVVCHQLKLRVLDMHALVGHRVLVMHKDLLEGSDTVWGWLPELPIEPHVCPVPPIYALNPQSRECSYRGVQG